jgi:hypothetical protein
MSPLFVWITKWPGFIPLLEWYEISHIFSSTFRIELLDGEVLDAITKALDLQLGTVASVVAFLAAIPAYDVLGIHHLSILNKGHALAVLFDMLCPCWDLVIAHQSQHFSHGL